MPGSLESRVRNFCGSWRRGTGRENSCSRQVPYLLLAAPPNLLHVVKHLLNRAAICECFNNLLNARVHCSALARIIHGDCRVPAVISVMAVHCECTNSQGFRAPCTLIWTDLSRVDGGFFVYIGDNKVEPWRERGWRRSITLIFAGWLPQIKASSGRMSVYERASGPLWWSKTTL